MVVNSEKYISEIIEGVEYLITEGFQASSLLNPAPLANIFRKKLVTHESSDLSFINGLVSTGLRASARIAAEEITHNYNEIVTAFRQHLPWVTHTNARVNGPGKFSALNNFESIFTVHSTGCFQFIASSAQEHIYLSLIAHRIAELSLIPALVISDYEDEKMVLEIPNETLILKYLGNPDDQIESPTPSQQMIFGKTRRRIPSWFNLDLPVSLGSLKNDQAISFEKAANQKYFIDHVQELLDQALKEFEEVFGVNFHPIRKQSHASKYAVVSLGGQIPKLLDQLSKHKKSVESISIQQLHPFPYKELAKELNGKKAISIFEDISITEPGSHSPFYYRVMNAINNSKTRCYSIKYGANISVEDLEMAVDHMLVGLDDTDYILGLKFTKPSSKYPKHEILLQEIENQYPNVNDNCKSANRSGDNKPLKTLQDVPIAIRKYRDSGPNFTKLSRFYADTAFFYAHNEEEELVADPFTAVPVVPSASASFFNSSDRRNTIPVFNPQNCTGCGDCFVQCPHSAIPPLVISIEELLKSASSIASSKGKQILKLSPVNKNLARLAGKHLKEKDIQNAGDILVPAFDDLTTQMNWEGEKLKTLLAEFNLLLEEIGQMPVAVTDTFYNLPVSISKTSGELFSLAINPSACTGCGICVQVCEEEALSMVENDEFRELELKKQFDIWENLPDIPGETINRLYHDKNYSSLSAMLLSRNYYMTMNGASNSEAYNPYKTLLHIISATAESVVQPKIISQLKSIDELIQNLSEQIHKNLSSALPKDNFEGLSKSLKKAKGEINTVEEMVQDLAGSGHNHYIDSEELSRKVDLVEDLKKLKWTLSEGPTGLGRSRYGLLLAGAESMDWARRFPANHFINPSIVYWNGSAPQQSLGLFYGHLRHALDHIKMMRHAALEIKNTFDPATHEQEIEGLCWTQLTDEEKNYIQPIFLIAERNDLNRNGWNDLNKILTESYPIKVVLMDHLATSVSSSLVDINQSFSGLISVMSSKKAFVFQGGMGNSEHLFKGLMDGIDRPYPALFNLYATKMNKHSHSNLSWPLYASLVLNSRSFPSLRYDPAEHGSFLGGAIELEGNKAKMQDWVEEEIEIANTDRIKYKISWADWAFTQPQWRNEFEAVEKSNHTILLTEYIPLDKKARKSSIPVIMRGFEKGLKYYKVSPQLVQLTESVLSNWNTLQELAGLRTEFPKKLKDDIEKSLRKQYEQAEIDLRKKYEEQLRIQEATQTELLRKKLKDKLLSLSLMANTKVKN